MSSPIDEIRGQLQDNNFSSEYGAELAKIAVAMTIAGARKEKNLTQEQLAEMTGTSQPYIAKLEKGYANPSIGTVAGILAVMGYRLITDTGSLVPEKSEMSKTLNG